MRIGASTGGRARLLTLAQIEIVRVENLQTPEVLPFLGPPQQTANEDGRNGSLTVMPGQGLERHDGYGRSCMAGA